MIKNKSKIEVIEEYKFLKTKEDFIIKLDDIANSIVGDISVCIINPDFFIEHATEKYASITVNIIDNDKFEYSFPCIETIHSRYIIPYSYFEEKE